MLSKSCRANTECGLKFDARTTATEDGAATYQSNLQISFSEITSKQDRGEGMEAQRYEAIFLGHTAAEGWSWDPHPRLADSKAPGFVSYHHLKSCLAPRDLQISG